MLSDSIIHSLTIVLKVGFVTGTFPYEWNRKERQLLLTRSKAKLIQWYVICVYMIINTSFMGVRLGQAVCCLNLSYGKLFMNLFNVVTWTTGCAFQINTYIHQKEIEEFVRQLLKSSQYFEGPIYFEFEYAFPPFQSMYLLFTSFINSEYSSLHE